MVFICIIISKTNVNCLICCLRSSWTAHFTSAPAPQLLVQPNWFLSSRTGWWFQPLWKIKLMGRIVSYIIMENKKCSKPPTRVPLYTTQFGDSYGVLNRKIVRWWSSSVSVLVAGFEPSVCLSIWGRLELRDLLFLNSPGKLLSKPRERVIGSRLMDHCYDDAIRWGSNLTTQVCRPCQCEPQTSTDKITH